MEKKKEFLEELYQLLDKYNVEMSIVLEGDTHCLDSWITVEHIPDSRIRFREEILNIDAIDKYEIKKELDRLNSML